PCGPHGRKSKLRWLRSCARSVKHPTTPPRSRSNAKGNVPRSTESPKRGEFHGRRRLPQHHSADRRRAARGGPCRTQPGRGGAGHLRARRPPAHAVRRVAHDQRRGPPLAADQHPPGDHQPDHRRAPGPARLPAHRNLRPPGAPVGGGHAADVPVPGGGVNYYEHHIGDYAAATAHLSLLEDAVYSRLLRRYYLQEAPLPADERQVARLAGARTPAEAAAVHAVLAEFFTLEADGWNNKRADEEIARYRESEPEREAKRKNERERQRRHGQRRAELFETLRQNGIVPPYDTPTSRLDEMASRVKSRVTGALHDGDATATQTPDTNNPSS